MGQRDGAHNACWKECSLEPWTLDTPEKLIDKDLEVKIPGLERGLQEEQWVVGAR